MVHHGADTRHFKAESLLLARWEIMHHHDYISHLMVNLECKDVESFCKSIQNKPTYMASYLPNVAVLVQIIVSKNRLGLLINAIIECSFTMGKKLRL